MGVRKGGWKSAMGISVAWTPSTGNRLVESCGRIDRYEIARAQSLSARQRHARRRLLVRRALALLDQPEHAERVAIVLGREVRDREGRLRPRHQLLDRSRLAEGGPEGEIVIIQVPSAIGVVEANEIPRAALPLARKLLSARSKRRRLHSCTLPG